MSTVDSEIKRYQLKAVIFDVQVVCKTLKKELSEAGIYILIPFFGLQVEYTLREMLFDAELVPSDCLMLTNNDQHARLAKQSGMAGAGCMEGHFEVPQAVTLLESPDEVSPGYLNMIYCHQQGIPATILETERCFIREITIKDVEKLYEIVTNPEVARYLPLKAGTKEEELEKLVSYAENVYQFFEYGYWGVFEKKTGEIIGRAGFKEGSYPLELGYVIKKSEWGKGLATEVVKGLLSYAEEELACTEVIANIEERNTASLRVAEKCGVLCNRLRG